MSRHSFDEERLCRINGKKPTAREQWWAFYRLWRITQKAGMWQSQEAVTCFRVFFQNWGFISCADDGDATNVRDGIDMAGVPKFLRYKFLDHRRKKRLYGKHYERMGQAKMVARKVREEHGIEVTPEECAAVRLKLIKHIRERALADGVTVPQDDDDLMRWMQTGGSANG